MRFKQKQIKKGDVNVMYTLKHSQSYYTVYSKKMGKWKVVEENVLYSELESLANVYKEIKVYCKRDDTTCIFCEDDF